MRVPEQLRCKSRAILAITACCWLLVACSTEPRPVPKAAFVLVDGIPADVIEGEPTPCIDAVAGTGGYARAYVGGTVGSVAESPTVSGVSYASLLTGTWANKHNVWDNSIAAPDYRYWDIFRIAKAHDPALRTSLYSTWTDNRTKLIGDGREEAGGGKLDFVFDGLELDTQRFPPDPDDNYIREIDALVAAEAARHIGETGPDVSWTYLQYSDDIAHRFGDGPELSAAVSFMDARICELWAAIENREASHSEDWLFIVTTDHGRDAETGKDHGGQSERERTIWIATNSTRLNGRFQQNPGIVDILPSIATHLGLSIPAKIAAQLDGESFID